MSKLKSVISNYPLSEARSAFYYLSRYLKQASFYDEYQKNIFEDGLESTPSETAKELTKMLIAFIEEKQGKKCSDFTDDEYIFWMDQIDAVESNLDPEPSGNQVSMAEKAIKELVPPAVSGMKRT